ncbi:transposase, partial [Chromatiales bacterium (ex Bugula neritina AB1)]
QVKTILNRCSKFKSFVYGTIHFVEDNGRQCLEIELLPRSNSRPLCSSCGKPAPLYDRLDQRRFEFIPLWGIAVFFLYVMRRVNCSRCGVKVEQIPWAKGKQTLTTSYQQFLAHWAKLLSWEQVAVNFNTSWDKVYRSVEQIVRWGLKHRDLDNVESIGVDEISWKKGHNYLTLVYQIDQGCKRLLWVGEDRTAKTLLRFFHLFGTERSQNLKHVCSDMWRAYIKVIHKKAPQAIHILDRFHIVANLNKAVNEVRAEEHRKMTADGYEPVLKKSRWCILKRPENLTEKQEIKLKEILSYNLKTVRAYLLKEDFDGFWDYTSPAWAEKYLDRWCTRVMRSKIDPMKKVARSIRKHKPLILNWFRAKKQFSSGIVEGLNNKAKVTTRTSYGFRTFKCAEIALYHALGNLPEPPSTHRFC